MCLPVIWTLISMQMVKMKIKSLASSSAGNCYLLQSGEDMLLIEAGISIKKIRQGTDFNLSAVSGCLVSHAHQDHCKALNDLIKAGVDCFMTSGTYGKAISSDWVSHRVHILDMLEQKNIGAFTVMAFPTVHDCEGSCGFLIVHGKDKILFATDTAFIEYRFKGLTHIMIESNYQESILEKRVDSGAISIPQKNRLLFSHFSLENVLSFLGDLDRSKLRECHLIHLSSGNSDAKYMRRKVAGFLGIPVYIAGE